MTNFVVSFMITRCVEIHNGINAERPEIDVSRKTDQIDMSQAKFCKCRSCFTIVDWRFYWTDGYWQGFGPFGSLSHFLGHAAAVTAWGQCAPAGQRTLPLHILYIYTYMYAYMYAVVV